MNLTISLRRTSGAAGLWYANHDLVARVGHGGSLGGGLPETNKCVNDTMFPVSAGLEALIRCVLRLLNPNMSADLFETNLRGLYRSDGGFSNGFGIQSGEWRIENLYCGGATFRAVTGIPVKQVGNTWLEVYALDPLNLPPLPTSLAEIDLTRWFFPTTAPMDNRSNPFPNFDGRCLIPFLGQGGRSYISCTNEHRTDGIGAVNADHIMNPFLPARWDVTAGLIDPRPGDKVLLIHDFQVPLQGTFRQLKHDFESPSYEYKPRSIKYNPGSGNAELPETIPLNPFVGADDFVPLTEAMQWFHFELLRKSRPDLSTEELKTRWRALTVNSVAFTDKHSIDYGTRFFGGDPSKNFADYILGENLYNPKPIAWKALSTGGNLVRIVQGTTIEAIDYTVPLPSIDEVWAKPWLIHWATSETITPLPTKVMVDGAMRNTWQVCRFPQLGPAGTPFPIWGRGGQNRVADSAALKPIANGAIFSPYFP